MQAANLKAPQVSVVVSTRNRPEHAAQCIATILENDGPEFELVVVDQSDDSGTEAVLTRHLHDRRLRYVRTEGRGLSVGRNLGIELTSGEIVAFTDDDCRVARDWIRCLAAVFAADPDTSAVFGRVRIPEGTFQNGGHAANFEPAHTFIRGAFPSPGTEIGIGANMAFRREALERVGPFDPLLGAGAPFQAGEEDDIVFRVLRAGMKVACAPEPDVLHLGVRTGAEIKSLVAGYHLGLGAALYKHVRLGDLKGVRSYLSWLGYFLAICFKNLVRGVRPVGIGMTLNYLRGALLSYRYGLDRGLRIYVTAPAAAAETAARYQKCSPGGTHKEGLMEKPDFPVAIKARVRKLMQRYPLAREAVWRVRRLARPAWLGSLRRTTPLSDVYGFDRGTPVDRYYVEHFLEENRNDIRGRVLEVKDSAYADRFGTGVTQQDVLDIDAANPRATVVADLAAADHVPADTFDCFLLIHTLQFIYDCHAAIRHAHRILRPGGVLLAVVGPVRRLSLSPQEEFHWGFLPASCSRLFGDTFGAEKVSVRSYGNVLSCVAGTVGMAYEELSPAELNVNDPAFPLILGVRAVK